MLGFEVPDSKIPLFYTIGNPTRDRIVTRQRVVDAFGGSVTYAAMLIQRFGKRAAVVGKGNTSVKKFYDSSGIDTTYFTDGYPIVEFENHYQGEERRQTAKKGVFISAEEVPEDVYSAPALLIGGVLNEVDPAIILRRRSAFLMADMQGFVRRVTSGGRVILEYVDHIDQIIRHCDMIKADQDEARMITRASDAETAARLLKAMGPQIAIVTRGRRGAVICDLHQVFHIEALPVDSIDSTGAGDVFAAAFLLQYLHCPDTVSAGRVAACAAALSTRAYGTQAIPTIDEVKAVLGTRGDTLGVKIIWSDRM